MNCPFCAETIRDEAILCRFCGARMRGDEWTAPAPPIAGQAPKKPPKGHLTLKTAGIFFLLSAAFCLIPPLTKTVPVFGQLQGGGAAAAYQVGYAVVMSAMGLGLWLGTHWGYRLIFASTALYTIDQGLFLLNRATQEAWLQTQLGSVQDLQGLIDPNDLITLTAVTTGMMIVCWWGFALYVYVRRAYFRVAVAAD